MIVIRAIFQRNDWFCNSETVVPFVRTIREEGNIIRINRLHEEGKIDCIMHAFAADATMIDRTNAYVMQVRAERRQEGENENVNLLYVMNKNCTQQQHGIETRRPGRSSLSRMGDRHLAEMR
jgi:hypothetical protein